MVTMKIFADYCQFYFMDLELCPLIPDEITDKDMDNRYRVADGIVVIHTQEPQYVSVTVKVTGSAPIPSESTKHLIQVPIRIPSGKFAILGSTESLEGCNVVLLPAGNYSAHIQYEQTDTGQEEFTISLQPINMAG
ncbi:hypothetical protein [Shewanella subflava]|uniref:Uncharacterized protein n=1 Tax=Shewanella subflava TaxID=2986476 RepID=A0ABT3I8G5_9GAMM|nr:hypothetical protein [Shewanella subflava]MCW3172365.1 hypothetical protein [Shewanella subflava]